MEDFVTFELAKKLKEKGFNEGCYKYYENKELKWSNSPWLETRYNNYMPHKTSAPTISQVLKWLREEKSISIEPCATPHNCWYYMIKYNGQIKVTYFEDKYKTYEQAAIAGIEYVLDNLI